MDRKKTNIEVMTINNIINECVNRCIKRFLNETILSESYQGELYHFTSIGLAYDIMKYNVIYTREDASQGHIDRRMEDKDGSEYVVSLSRNGTFGDGYEKNFGISVRFTIDANKLLNAHNKQYKVHPYYYSGFPTQVKNYDFDPEKPETGLPYRTEPGSNVTHFESGEWHSYSEFEERLYNHDIEPLDEYCTRIDILVRDITQTDDSEILWDDDFDYVPTYEGNREHDAQVNQTVIQQILNMPRWKGKVFVHNINKRYVSAYAVKNKLHETIEQQDVLQQLQNPNTVKNLLVDFLNNTKEGNPNARRPSFKELIQYPRYDRYKLQGEDSLEHICTTGGQLIDFDYVQNIVTTFLFYNTPDEGQWSGYFDYDKNTGHLRFSAKMPQKKEKDSNGDNKHYVNPQTKERHVRTLPGTYTYHSHHRKSPKGIYEPYNVHGRKYQTFGNIYDKYFNPTYPKYDAQLHVIGHGNSQLHQGDIPIHWIEKDNPDNRLVIDDMASCIMSIFGKVGNVENYNLFKLFLYEVSKGLINGYEAWKNLVDKSIQAKHLLVHQVQDIYEQQLKTAQDIAPTPPSKKNDDYHGEPKDNNTPEKSAQVAKWLEMMDD